MTENTTRYAEQASVYPGKYEPLPWKEKELQDEIHKKGARIAKPPIHVRELSDYYKFEIDAPGFRAEDFFINADGCTLSITACNKRSGDANRDPDESSQGKCACLNRQYNLPSDTDINFATAEYRNGVLHLFFFKTAYPGENRPGRIVVY